MQKTPRSGLSGEQFLMLKLSKLSFFSTFQLPPLRATQLTQQSGRMLCFQRLCSTTLNYPKMCKCHSSLLGDLVLRCPVSPQEMKRVSYLLALHKVLNRSMEKEEEFHTGKEGCVLRANKIN